jgi:hypothetical protein
MKRETIHSVLMAVGVIILVISLFADLVGIGTYPGINVSQIAGIALGLAILIFAYWFGRTGAGEK